MDGDQPGNRGVPSVKSTLFAHRPRLAAVLVLLVGVALAWGLLVGKPSPSPEVPGAPPPPLVDVVRVEPTTRRLTVQSQGTVQARREIDLVSRVAGVVESVGDEFAAGGFFSANEPLVILDSVDYELAVVGARSRLASARQQLAEEQGRARQARREWRDLGNDQANALFLREPQLAAAHAGVETAEADLQAARLELERTRIAAPFAGRILSRSVDTGQYITPGTPVARVYATDLVEIPLPLTDRQLALLDLPLRERAPASDGAAPVTLSAVFGGQRWQWQGRIVRTAASIDPESRVLYAIAQVSDPMMPGDNGRPPLMPGLFVDAGIAGRALPGIVTLPRSALRNDDSVWIVDGEQRLQRRPVTVLHSVEGRASVQGLARGDRVVVREPAVSVAGMAVTVNEVRLVDGAVR